MLRRFAVLFALALFPVTGPAHAFDTGPPDLEQRRESAESGRYLRFSPSNSANATGSSLAQAMDADPAMLASSSTSGATSSSAVLSNLGVIKPLRGSSFAILSSGQAGTAQAEPGVDFLPSGSGGDASVLSLVLNVPQGSGRISFSYRFLSTEYPEYIDAGFNDTFTASLADANGQTVIATSNVDSAPFFPASQSEAGGSGFALFTPDPSGVTTQFGSTGLPDAGLTEYVMVNVPFQSSGQIVVTFSISDVGDGILDSAVILDNLTVSSIEVVDAVPDFFTSGSFVTDPTALATRGRRRQGAAADGVTRLIVRSRVAGPGNVVFSLDNGSAPQDGGFDTVGGSGRNPSVTVPAVQTPAGYVAFAVYRTPDEFNRGSDDGATDRTVTLKAAYTPSGGGGGTVSRFPLRLVRPPLVFIHGLWSNQGTWQFPLVQDSRFPSIEVADYQGSNAKRFAVNSQVANRHIQAALEKLHRQDIAATQVDLIGHSMGGLLGRIWIADDGSTRDANYNAGDVRKLLTLDTPHTGSPLANLLVSIRDNFFLGSAAKKAFRYFDMPIDEGAVDDLAKGSSAIASIPAVSVPTHAFLGTGGSDNLALAPGLLGDFYSIVNFFANATGNDLFEGLQHDMIVGRLSQKGGLPDSAATAIGGLDGLHIGLPPLIPGNTGSALYSAGLSDLIDTPAGGGQFAPLPAPAAVASADAAALKSALEAKVRVFKSVGPGLTITSPFPGFTVSPGDTVTVTVEPSPGVNVNRVLITGPSVAQVDETPPFEIDVEIPVEEFGEITLTALGSNDQGQLFTSQDLTLYVEPVAFLTALELFPKDPLLLGPGDTIQLHVLGHFSDGVVREIGDPLLGTSFSSVEPEFAVVSPDGVVTAVQPGVTTLLASSWGLQDSVTVNIMTGQGGYFTVAPCRLFDSRNPDGPLGGPILQSGLPRTINVSGNCGLPASPIAALAVNVTIVAPNGAGHLVLQPAGSVVGTSTINFRAGQVRANNALVQLSANGELTIVPAVTGINGAVHVIVDVSGYFVP
ncbi:MAG TPA: alpha/beta fold hydrolase [Thermoanaerobaculia bacterium]|nr:alpha/beta fold hydrolase [Thermoanaerobaculia bacterium]